jgi:hypothetical protein
VFFLAALAPRRGVALTEEHAGKLDDRRIGARGVGRFGVDPPPHGPPSI